MMRNKKLGLVALVIAALLVSSVAAWTVLNAANIYLVNMNVKKASVTVGSSYVTVNIGAVKSGYDFSIENDDQWFTISDAKELKVSWATYGMTADEADDLSSCTVKIYHDINNDGFTEGDTLLVTINALTSVVDPAVSTLGEGGYNLAIKVYGTAAYPEFPEANIDFMITITFETP
jgi:hypothetical protein